MTRNTLWMTAFAFVVGAGHSAAADAISFGKIKSINSDKKEFVLTDPASKDWTIKIGDDLVVNRLGKESASDLKTGETVAVCYDKGVLTWTANYVLVQDGDGKNSNLVHGTIKGYDASKKELVFADLNGKDWTFPMDETRVRLNRKVAKAEDLKIGDKALILVDAKGDKSMLKELMIHRDE